MLFVLFLLFKNLNSKIEQTNQALYLNYVHQMSAFYCNWGTAKKKLFYSIEKQVSLFVSNLSPQTIQLASINLCGNLDMKIRPNLYRAHDADLSCLYNFIGYFLRQFVDFE